MQNNNLKLRSLNTVLRYAEQPKCPRQTMNFEESEGSNNLASQGTLTTLSNKFNGRTPSRDFLRA